MRTTCTSIKHIVLPFFVALVFFGAGLVSVASADTYSAAQAQTKVNNTKDLVQKLASLIVDAETEEVDTDDAVDIKDEANELIAEAEVQISFEDYDDSHELASEAADLLTDFIADFEDDIDEVASADARKLIGEAEDWYEAAENIMRDIDDDHRKYNSLKELYDSADTALEEAKAALKKKNYDEAVTKAAGVKNYVDDLFALLDEDVEDYFEIEDDTASEVEVVADESDSPKNVEEDPEVVADDTENTTDNNEQLASLRMQIQQLNELITLLIQLRDLKAALGQL